MDRFSGGECRTDTCGGADCFCRCRNKAGGKQFCTDGNTVSFTGCNIISGTDGITGGDSFCRTGRSTVSSAFGRAEGRTR